MIRGRFERRAHPRAPVRLEAAYEDADGDVFLRIEDLSEGGAWLAGAVAPAPGAPARLVLELPGEPALQRLRVRVVRVVGGPRPGFAVRFEDPGPGARRSLRALVERRLGWRRAS